MIHNTVEVIQPKSHLNIMTCHLSPGRAVENLEGAERLQAQDRMVPESR